MNTKRMAACVSILAGMMACPAAPAEEPLLLRHRLEKDQTLIYRTELLTEQVQTVGEQKIESQFKHDDVTVRSLEKVTDDGNLRLRAENKRLEVKTKVGPLGEYKFDSTSTERDKGSVLALGLNPLYERLSGASLAVVVSPRGKVLEVEGYEELVGDVLKDNPLGRQFAGGGSKQGARLAYQEGFEQFPEEPVKAGDRWEVPFEVDVPGVGKAQGKRVYTYEGPDKAGDRETARIGVAVELAFDLNLDVNGAKVTGKLSTANATGTVQFDPLKGHAVSKKVTFTIAGDLSVEVNGKTIPIRTEQTQTATTELLDKLPE